MSITEEQNKRKLKSLIKLCDVANHHDEFDQCDCVSNDILEYMFELDHLMITTTNAKPNEDYTYSDLLKYAVEIKKAKIISDAIGDLQKSIEIR